MGTSAYSNPKIPASNSKASQNVSKSDGSWNRIQSDEDQVQLTTFADEPGFTRPKGNDGVSGGKDIHVKTWESHAV